MKLNLRSSAHLHSEDRKKNGALWLTQTFDTCFFCAVTAYPVHFPQQIKLITKMSVTFLLKSEVRGWPDYDRADSCYKDSPKCEYCAGNFVLLAGACQIFEFIEGFGEVCKFNHSWCSTAQHQQWNSRSPFSIWC